MGIKERIRKNEIIEKKVVLPFPKSMLIELTNHCNHSCVFCANSKMTRKKGLIDENFVIRILNEAYVEGTREVGFYATGEPFISIKLSKYVSIAKKIGYTYVYITTNGALATPDRATEIIKAGIDSIKFSINAGTKEKYKMIHGRDDFESVLNNLKNIYDYRKEHKLNFKIYVSYIVTKYTDNEKEDFKEEIKNYIDDIIFVNVGNQGGMMDEINKYLKLENDEKDIRSLPCSMLFNSIQVTFEGYMSACCVDFQNYLTVADLRTTSLKEAWNGEKFVELRKKHLENKVEGILCHNCIYNKNQNVKPLILEHATKYDVGEFRKDGEIRKRLSKVSLPVSSCSRKK